MNWKKSVIIPALLVTIGTSMVSCKNSDEKPIQTNSPAYSTQITGPLKNKLLHDNRYIEPTLTKEDQRKKRALFEKIRDTKGTTYYTYNKAGVFEGEISQKSYILFAKTYDAFIDRLSFEMSLTEDINDIKGITSLALDFKEIFPPIETDFYSELTSRTVNKRFSHRSEEINEKNLFALIDQIYPSYSPEIKSDIILNEGLKVLKYNMPKHDYDLEKFRGDFKFLRSIAIKYEHTILSDEIAPIISGLVDEAEDNIGLWWRYDTNTNLVNSYLNEAESLAGEFGYKIPQDTMQPVHDKALEKASKDATYIHNSFSVEKMNENLKDGVGLISIASRLDRDYNLNGTEEKMEDIAKRTLESIKEMQSHGFFNHVRSSICNPEIKFATTLDNPEVNEICLKYLN